MSEPGERMDKFELAPMKDLRKFVARVADDHEHRIGALEKHTGLH